jgi:hypothetical protein
MGLTQHFHIQYASLVEANVGWSQSPILGQKGSREMCTMTPSHHGIRQVFDSEDSDILIPNLNTINRVEDFDQHSDYTWSESHHSQYKGRLVLLFNSRKCFPEEI